MKSASGTQQWQRLVLVAVIALGIVGVTFAVGQRAGWSSIGSGGVNAQLLPRVGDSAPDLFTLSANGEPVLLSSLKGRPVWLNFWGSWCEPCQAEMPDIEAAYMELAPQGLVMLGISQKEDVRQSVAYANAAGATFPIYMDPIQVWDGLDESTIPPDLLQIARDTKSWQVNNQPTHIFIDSNGIVQAVVISPMTKAQAIGYGEQIISVPFSGRAIDTSTPNEGLSATPSS